MGDDKYIISIVYQEKWFEQIQRTEEDYFLRVKNEVTLYLQTKGNDFYN